MHDLAAALRDALAGSPACLVRLPLGWHGADLQAGHPLDYLGMDGGAGIGSGPGMAVGAALALEGSGRLAGGRPGRRRLPDGRDRGVDRGALPAAAC